MWLLHLEAVVVSPEHWVNSHGRNIRRGKINCLIHSQTDEQNALVSSATGKGVDPFLCKDNTQPSKQHSIIIQM